MRLSLLDSSTVLPCVRRAANVLNSLTATVLAATAAVLLPAIASAQAPFPSKVVRILVGAPPGGSNDLFARAIGQRLSEEVKQPVVIENRPGASQMIAAELTAKAPPDGHTMYVSTSTYTATAALRQKLPFDPIGDITGVTLLGKAPLVLVVHPSLPVRSVKELIDLLRKRPGQLNFTSSGIGSINHMAAEMFRLAAKIDIVHVPQKGIAPGITDLISGQVQLLFVSMPSVGAQIENGRLRALAVTSAQPTALIPGIPTVAATGLPGFEVDLWWGMFIGSKTPKPIVDRLNAEITKILASEEMKKRFASTGAETAPTSPEVFTAMIKSEIERWSRVVKAGQIRAD